MKKAAALILTLCFILVFSGCEKDNVYQIKITIPAGSTDWFVYSDEDISRQAKRSLFPLAMEWKKQK